MFGETGHLLKRSSENTVRMSQNCLFCCRLSSINHPRRGEGNTVTARCCVGAPDDSGRIPADACLIKSIKSCSVVTVAEILSLNIRFVED